MLPVGTSDSRRPLWRWRRPLVGPKRLAPLVAALGIVMLGWRDEIATERATAARDAQTIHAAPRAPARPPLNGADFPDGVLALTWDDGPDTRTLELAHYLHAEKVSGTFFVVGDWAPDISEEPGVGANVYETGYHHLPVLGDLVALGHRVGGHTENHVLLAGAADATVSEQVGQAQHEIDPFLGNELRMFRAPGGAWSRAAATAVADPLLLDLVGPIHWDIDAKDWEGSLYCRSLIASECEPGPIPGRTRVRPNVIARRYVALAERVRRGIVLLHDRVGHVGSRYALDVARRVVPELTARGFVFSAPVLAFGPLSPRLELRVGGADSGVTHFADVDGDGRDDVCREESGLIVCARASVSPADAGARPRTIFEAPRAMLRIPEGVRSVELADIDGDHRADLCALTDDAVECAVAVDEFAFGPFQRWSGELTPLQRSTYAASFRLADVDGDGRADACARSHEGILCATSTNGAAFGHPRVWLGGNIPDDSSRLELADLDGDGRADICGDLPVTRRADSIGASHGIACAISNGRAFGSASVWSVIGDFDGHASIRLADLNRDGRSDVCAVGPTGTACAFSNGLRFKHSSIWSEGRPTDLRLADINGDGRADLCTVTKDRIDCGMAP